MTLEDPPQNEDDATDSADDTSTDAGDDASEPSASASGTEEVPSAEPSGSTDVPEATEESSDSIESADEATEPAADETSAESSDSASGTEEVPSAEPSDSPELDAEPPASLAEEAAVATAESPDGDAAPAAEVTGTDPYGGPGDWYVIHTYAGYENKVKTNLESRIHTMQMQDKVFDVVIPMEDVMEIKGGKKQVVQKKVFPGYLLVKMVYDDDSWYVVRNTPGVTGFVSSGTGQKPTPLSRREVEKILAVKKEEVKPAFRLDFEEGDVVRIISGPFADFNGTISDINVDQSKVRVMVNIFDRETPVELSFDQVARV
jgi:transcription termination/antitermination protein NusG